ncbi:MAG: hypothetical protein H0V92_07445 [Pseudonocardiales bacterium]|nr:hypothetical protein [Pseudonocardiales bacterium]
MSNATLTIVIIIAVIAVAAMAVAGIQISRRKRTEQLRKQYGPEYDRAVEHADNQREAESELRDRVTRHKELELRHLDRPEREEFERRWSKLQGQFVDDPSHAVQGADRLAVDVMSARGYPVDDFEQRADDLSVSHPEVTQRYREARKIAKANVDGSADTEELRQAVTSYRALVTALLSEGESEADDRNRNSQPDRGRQQELTRTSGPDTGRSDMGKGDRDGDRNGHVRDGGDRVRTTERETEQENKL